MMEQVKKVVGWIIIPFGLLLSALFYLFQKNRTLSDEVAKQAADRAFDKVKDKLSEVSKDADQKEADFKSLDIEFHAALAKYGSGDVPDGTK